MGVLSSKAELTQGSQQHFACCILTEES